MKNSIKIPHWKVIGILIGFPIISYLLSLLLLNKSWISNLGLDFFETFWLLVALWYIIQIVIVVKTLKASELNLSDIGYSLDVKKTIGLIIVYLAIAFSLFAVVEFALASENITPEMLDSLSDFSNITPKTTEQRILFIFAGLFAGISEEMVYRGFAINTIEQYNVNKWVAVVLASIPFVFQHGLKALDQFYWFFFAGIFLGTIYLLTKRRLYITIIIHWIIILSALLAILQLIE